MSDIKTQIEALDFSGDKVMVLRIPKNEANPYTGEDVQNLIKTVDQISKDMKVKIPVLVLPEDIKAQSLTKDEIAQILSTLEK